MIERNINQTLLNQEPSSKSLVQMLINIDQKKSLGQCSVYHHFPLYPNSESNKTVTANILFCSQIYGIIIFKCIDFSNRVELSKPDIISELDEIDRLIYAKLLKDAPNLRSGRRDLKVKIRSIVFLNNYNPNNDLNIEFDDFTVIKSEIELDAIIKVDKNPISDLDYNDLKATIEGSKGIPRPLERSINPLPNSPITRGAILTKIENQICNFDLEQKRAALFTLDGAQRIRGLAGSGKTIILCMKAAIIHLQNPNVEVLYTYYTKALHDVVKRLITRFYRQFADKDPDWRKIHIMHAWGGKGLEGVYYNACNSNDVQPMTLLEAKASSNKDPFEYICELLNMKKLSSFYDYALLDEAQDFPPTFYKVCRQLTKNNRVVWAYDDFQNILHVNMQSEKETFGKNIENNWHIDFDRKEDELQDLVLHQCYRNPRKILITAFALGLGIYNKDENTGKVQIVQRLESNDHWQSLGFEVEAGQSGTGEEMVISRPLKNSPLLKNEFLDNENEIIKIFIEGSFTQECNRVIGLILDDLKEQLKPEDISVICLDNRNAKMYFSEIAKKLSEKKYKTFNLLTAPNDNIVYKITDHITLSTIYRAKGNEAGSVYIMGIDSVFSASNRNDITERNKLFTAITRAQGWVTLTGIGDAKSDQCIKEFNNLKNNDFKLIFKQPSEKDVMTIRQNMNRKQTMLNKLERMADELAKDLGVSKDNVIDELKNKIQNKK
jgi:superfamily I DNA and RNA helicase